MNLVTCYPRRNHRSADLQTLLGLAPVPNPQTVTRESRDHYVLQIDLPGVRKEDVKISVENAVLKVEAVRHLQTEDEPRTATYQRSYGLSDDVDVDKIAAEQKDGVLTITFPKKEESKPKTININIS